MGEGQKGEGNSQCKKWISKCLHTSEEQLGIVREKELDSKRIARAGDGKDTNQA